MIRLSDSAKDELTAFFANKAASPLRIQPAPGGCMGPKLTLDLGERRKDDEVVDMDGLIFVINKDLMTQVGQVTIDVDYTGFVISSERPPSHGCTSDGDCGSCAGGGGTICPF